LTLFFLNLNYTVGYLDKVNFLTFAKIFKINMAKRKKRKEEDELLVDLVGVQEQTQDFLAENQKYILGGLLLAVLLVGGYFAYQHLYKAPREKEAIEQMYRAEQQFQRDSFALALNNPGEGYPGFEGIIADYGDTKAGNLAKYYAGLSALRTGDFQKAVNYLEDFNARGNITPSMAKGALGDAYSELENLDKAMGAYEKAATTGTNDFSTPYYLWKAGLLAQKQGDSGKAKKFFEQIKKDYPSSAQGKEIDKYLN